LSNEAARGRGTLDNKGPGIMEELSFVMLKRLKTPLVRDVVLLAVADEEHVLLVNDYDFGIHEDAADNPPPRTCLWVVRLARPVPLTQR
jgi:hypothetical protein